MPNSAPWAWWPSDFLEFDSVFGVSASTVPIILFLDDTYNVVSKTQALALQQAQPAFKRGVFTVQGGDLIKVLLFASVESILLSTKAFIGALEVV